MKLWQRVAGLSPIKRELLQRELVRRGVALPAELTGQRTLSMSVAELEAEAQLDASIRPPSGPRASVGEAERVLLTGATGFLGTFVLHQLLASTTAEVYCVVRATSLDEARSRLQHGLASAGLEDSSTSHRIIAVPGDVSAPRLGLAESAFGDLASRIDAVYHCAAQVNWIYPFSALRATNVTGTHEALRFATTQRAKPFHFISTIGVFSSSEYSSDAVFEDQPLDTSGPLHIGYAQTKWVAEHLVHQAAARGLPTTIFRPAIAPHSISGVFKKTDHVCLLIKGCVQLGSAPDLGMLIDLAPVDYVSNAIVQLSRQPTAVGSVFHLVNPAPMRWAEVIAHLVDRGYALELVGYDEWKARLLGDVLMLRNNALFGLSPLLSEALIENARLPRFDSARTLGALTASGVACPPADGRLLDTFLRYSVATGFLPSAA